MSYLLTILILLPVAGALGLVLYSLVSNRGEEHYRWIALITTLVTFAASLLLLKEVGAGTADFHFQQNVSWIGLIGSRYHVAIDGISLWLLLFTALFFAILGVLWSRAIRHR